MVERWRILVLRILGKLWRARGRIGRVPQFHPWTKRVLANVVFLALVASFASVVAARREWVRRPDVTCLQVGRHPVAISVRLAAGRPRIKEVVDRLESAAVRPANLMVLIQTVLQLDVRKSREHLIAVDTAGDAGLALCHHAVRPFPVITVHKTFVDRLSLLHGRMCLSFRSDRIWVALVEHMVCHVTLVLSGSTGLWR